MKLHHDRTPQLTNLEKLRLHILSERLDRLVDGQPRDEVLTVVVGLLVDLLATGTEPDEIDCNVDAIADAIKLTLRNLHAQRRSSCESS